MRHLSKDNLALMQIIIYSNKSNNIFVIWHTFNTSVISFSEGVRGDFHSRSYCWLLLLDRGSDQVWSINACEVMKPSSHSLSPLSFLFLLLNIRLGRLLPPISSIDYINVAKFGSSWESSVITFFYKSNVSRKLSRCTDLIYDSRLISHI